MTIRSKPQNKLGHIRTPCRIRKKCLRIINESSPTEVALFNNFRHFHNRHLTSAKKFVDDSIGDGYIRLDPSTSRYHLTKEGRLLLYDLDRQFYETVRYMVTTVIAVAALVVSILF